LEEPPASSEFWINIPQAKDLQDDVLRLGMGGKEFPDRFIHMKYKF
jgi:hypothetical protein